MPGEPLLRVTGLGIAHRGAMLLEGISFELQRGERLALMGPSGAGKSLLVHSIAGTLRAPLAITAGRVECGMRCHLVFQNPGSALNPCLTIRTTLTRLARRAGNETAVDSALASIGMSHAVDLYPHQLSGGMKQRIVFAAAQIEQPQLLIADEPTTGLDPVSRLEFCTALEQLLEATGAALLLISHDAALTRRICSRTLRLEAGRQC